jgi:hypothetical protein
LRLARTINAAIVDADKSPGWPVLRGSLSLTVGEFGT